MTSSTSRCLAFRTLGAAALVRVSDDGAEQVELEVSKLLALLTYLAAAPGRSATREQLVGLLWSDLEPEAGKHAVRQHLWQIRRRFGEELVIEGRETLTLLTPLRSDRDDLLEAAEHGDLVRVVQLHRGDFFPGFAAPGSGEMERWVEAEQSRLRAIFLRSGELLVRQWLSSARARDAQALARRLRAAEPLRQQSWRLLLESLIAASDPIGAAVEAEAFEQLLRDEGIEPEPASTTLIKAARRVPPDGAPPTLERPALAFELVGREREFAFLMRAWEDARRGRPVVVAMSGPPGLGKTRLLHEFHARLESLRARSVRVRAEAGARAIAHALTSDLAAALATLPGARGISPASARTLVALNPSLSTFYATAATPRYGDDHAAARLAAVRELITAVSEERPVAILIDDVHWADADSRALLAAVCGGLERSAVLVVTASRPTSDVAAPAGTTRPLPLSPLTVDAIASLIASLGTLPAEPWAESLAEDLARASGGSPLHLLETVQLLTDAGTLVVRDGAWSCADAAALEAGLQHGGSTRRRIAATSHDAQSVLGVLAIAGWPIAASLIARTMQWSAEMVAETLRELEHAGLAVRRGVGWSPAHDEFGDAALDFLPPLEHARVHSALGRTLLTDAHDSYSMRRAAAHLYRGEEHGPLAALFARYVKRSRREKDLRAHVALAADLVGLDRTHPDVTRLAATLPLLVRVGLVTWPRVAAATAFVLLATTLTAAAAATFRRPLPPDAALLVLTQSQPDHIRVTPVPVRDSAWQTSPFHVGPAGGSKNTLPIHLLGSDLVPSPGYADRWVFARPVNDSGVTDLFLLDNGKIRRLTASVGDDVDPSWSPDGRLLVFRTGRWNELRHDDLAIMDVGTGVTRQLTSGDPTDRAPRWSPDGTRIAFLRRYWTGRQEDLCIIPVSGGEASCRQIAGARAASIAGWARDSVVHYLTHQAERVTLTARDVDRGEDSVVERDIGFALTSPDGRWIAIERRNAGRRSWWIVSAQGTARRREIRIDTTGAGRVLVAWSVTAQRLAFLDSISIDPGAAPPAIGVPHQLRVRGTASDGSSVEPRLVRWSVDDPTVASVDSLGILHPHRAGKVRVTANAGGWRTTWLQLSVRVPASAIEEIEEWNALSDTRWVAFGMPRPSIVDTPEGRRALHNAGDGTFLSGVYSTAEFAAREGVGIDAELSTPVSLGQWQSQHVAFIIDADSTVLRSWDHVSGFFPNAAAPTAGVCGFSYPAGAEGVTYAETMNGGSGNVPGARWLGSGRWYRIRVQLLPDGRCAVAVNDRAVAITAPAARLDSRIRIALFGQSFNTQMLVGRLEVFRGVKTDVTWAELDSTLALRGSAWRAGARRVAAMPSPATAVYRANAR